MNQNLLTISWKDPVNRGAAISIFGISLLIQSIVVLHAMLIYKIGTSNEELIFLFVTAILMGIVLTVLVLTGFEYLNERQKEVKYMNISGMGILVILVFMIAYNWGFEVLKLYAANLAATPTDLIFLISEIIGVFCVFVVFFLYRFYQNVKASMTI